MLMDEAVKASLHNLDNAMRSIPFRIRIALELRYLDNKTFQEVGDTLKVNRSRAAILVNNGLRMMRHTSRLSTLLGIDDNCEVLEIHNNIYKNENHNRNK